MTDTNETNGVVKCTDRLLARKLLADNPGRGTNPTQVGPTTYRAALMFEGGLYFSVIPALRKERRSKVSMVRSVVFKVGQWSVTSYYMVTVYLIDKQQCEWDNISAPDLM